MSLLGPGSGRPPRWGCWALAVSLGTALAFARSIGGDFVAWDDEVLLVHNEAYRGLGWPQLAWMARSVLLGHYVPVTWLSFALDHAVWGLDPRGYHLTNALLHAANAGLVFLLAARILGLATVWPARVRGLAALVAALFWALHPLRVEAVSWVTGRRDVLSGFLFLVALGAYLEAARPRGPARRWRWLATSLAAYALALGAKAVLMTAPLALVALDVYPLGRLPADVRRWGDRTLRRTWLEKVPFVALAVLAGVASSVAVSHGTGYQVLSLSTWLAKVAIAAAHPVWSTFVPLSLSPLYELPRSIDLRTPVVWWSALLAMAVTAAVVAGWRRWPGGAVAWVWQLTFLAPVSAIAHAGPQITADRYSYLPTLGLSLLVGAVVGRIAGPAREAGFTKGRRAVVPLVLALLLGLALLTWRQQAIWADTGRLWAHAVIATPACMRCHVSLAGWLMAQGRPGDALPHYERALTLDPGRTMLHTNVGLALVRLGRPGDAVPHYERVLADYPGLLPVRASLATALLAAGRSGEALARLAEAARYQPPKQIVAYFGQLAAEQPTAVVPQLALIPASVQLGDPARARSAAAALRRLDPELAGVVARAYPAVAGQAP